MLNKEQAEAEVMSLRLQTAKLELTKAISNLRPSFTFPVSVTLNGSRWVCTLATDIDPMKCVTAYGESPAQAMENFDLLWMGSAEFLVDGEPEEEEF